MFVKNFYFNLSDNNITLSILEGFSLKKIDNNIKADISFLHFLIWEVVGVKIINTADYNSDTSATTPFATNNKKNLHFRNSQDKNDISNKYSSSDESTEDLGSDKSDFNPDEIQKNHYDCYQNKVFITIMSLYMLIYAQNRYANLLQMVNSYFSFARNLNKKGTKVYHKMGLMVSYKMVQQALNANG